ncbi:hypothetical protein F4806DRAFT_277019 [Annulohypoxylon nitens]|nr:hypothetical protein F4806DRAFT_277019 [Annulohypoxylon nitens]
MFSRMIPFTELNSKAVFLLIVLIVYSRILLLILGYPRFQNVVSSYMRRVHFQVSKHESATNHCYACGYQYHPKGTISVDQHQTSRPQATVLNINVTLGDTLRLLLVFMQSRCTWQHMRIARNMKPLSHVRPSPIRCYGSPVLARPSTESHSS